jgi:M6 family metalloprotease-like protein
MKKVTIKFILSFALIFIMQISFAVPANPTPFTFTQPSGDTLTVMLKGDERIHWSESMDEYTLLQNKAGYLSYAVLDENGNLQPSDFIATDIEKRDASVISFLNTIEKKLFFSDLQREIMKEVWRIEDEATALQLSKNEKGITGHYKSICAFVEFSDAKFIKNREEFEGLFNTLGYTENGANGSVRDYFKETSYNQMDLTISLFGPYTAAQSKAYYAINGCSLLAYQLAKKVTDDPDINLKDFDSNGNGKLDNFHFIFAGRGQEVTGKTTDIWSHKGSFIPAVTKDGVSISTYSCSPELKGSSGKNITGIGVICHEMTHTWGAPDYYDTDYETGGEFAGVGNWCLMASGCYNGNSNTPAQHNPLIKINYGWVTPTILNSEKDITDMPNFAESPVTYRINTGTANEYYLLENRQKVGFDSSIPGVGLLIFHVHPNQAGNCINCTHPQRMYLVNAGGTCITQQQTANPACYGGDKDINSSRCPFPGTNNNTSFTAETTPAMKSWFNNYAGVNRPITGITNKDGLISFVFMYGMGIEEQKEGDSASLTIIPNPANDFIDIQFSANSAKFGNIDIYNGLGVLVKSIPCNGVLKDNMFTQRISISDFSKGFYFVNVGNSTAKLVVQ